MDKWLDYQRIGVTAYLLCNNTKREQYSLFKALNDLLLRYIGKTGSFNEMPPSVLFLLKGTEIFGFKKNTKWVHLQKVNKAIELLQTKGEGYSDSPLGKAQVLAYHALLGNCDAMRWKRLGENLFGKEIWSVSGGEDVISSSLRTLRSPWSITSQRCQAIAQLTKLLGNTPYWSQVENILYSSQFCWPLLVLGPNAFSLPVAVDVNFESSPKKPQVPQVLVYGAKSEITEDNKISIKDWHGHQQGGQTKLERCVKVGKQLWRAKHGNYGEFREKVGSAQVLFDFTEAQKIVKRIFNDLESHYGWPKNDKYILLKESSADAYFAQVVLQRLLGKSSLIGSAVTGMIGEQLPYQEITSVEEEVTDSEKRPVPVNPPSASLQRNYKFETPVGVSSKLKYIFACKTFERAVLPYGTKINSGELKEQSAQVLYADNMQTLADILQIRGWRQYQYIRCPEVGWAIHTRPGIDTVKNLLKQESLNSRVQQVIDLLSNAAEAMVEWKDCSPVLVALALQRINNEKRSSNKFSPPSLSWAFVRILDTEQDSWFWELLWHIIGASPSSFEELVKNPKKETILENLIYAFNRFTPDLANPSHRAPDIIVLIGTDYLQQSAVKTHNPSARPFMVWPLLEELKKRLSSISRNGHLIGKTRIICLPAETAEDLPFENVSLEQIEDREHELLSALTAFKHGFTQHGASLLLSSEFGEEYRGIAVREKVLDPFVKRGLLRYGPQGIYHFENVSLEQIEDREHELLSALTAFKHGFTQHGASLLLSSEFGEKEYSGIAVREKVLDPFVKRGLLRYGPQGIYHLPQGMIKNLGGAEDNQLARRYYQVGRVLAPYAVDGDFPALALDVAFSPINVHEATWYFHKAETLAKTTKDKNLQNKIGGASDQLRRFEVLPGWKLVNKLLYVAKNKVQRIQEDRMKWLVKQDKLTEILNISEDAYHIAKQLLDWNKKAGVPDHPAHLLQIANVAEEIAKAYKNKGVPKKEEEYLQLALSYFKQALENCKNPRFSEDKPNYNRLVVLTYYVTFLQYHKGFFQRNEERQNVLEERTAYSEEALALLKEGVPVDGILTVWMFNTADSPTDHTQALELYQKAIEAFKEEYHFYVKAIGAASLAGLNEEVEWIINRLKEANIWNEKAKQACEKIKKHRPRHVLERYNEGLRLIEQKGVL